MVGHWARVTFIVLLSVVGLGGCFDDEPPARRRLNAKTLVRPTATAISDAPGCGVTAQPVDGGKIGEDLFTSIDAVRAARVANDEANAVVGKVVARVGPALEDELLGNFIAELEKTATVEEAGGQTVLAIREEFLEQTRALAGKLDTIDADAALAAKAVEWDQISGIMNAYRELSFSPCPARAIRFVGRVYESGSPYAEVLNNITHRGTLDEIVANGTVGAVVERVAETNDAESALKQVRGYFGNALGTYDKLADVIANRRWLVDYAKGICDGFCPGEDFQVGGYPFAPVLKAIGGALAVWSAGEAAFEGDVLAILQTGPSGVQALANGTAWLQAEFGWSRIDPIYAKNVASAAGTLAKALGRVFSVIEIIKLSDELDTTSGRLEFAGNVLLLVATFTPPPFSLVLGVAGTVSVIAGKILGAPKEIDIRPMVTAVGLSAQTADALSYATNDNIRYLQKDLELPPADLRWVLTRSYGWAGDAGYAGLENFRRAFGMKGATMMSLLRAVAQEDEALGFFELQYFEGVARRPDVNHMPDGRSIKNYFAQEAKKMSTASIDPTQWWITEDGAPSEDALRDAAKASFERAVPLMQ